MVVTGVRYADGLGAGVASKTSSVTAEVRTSLSGLTLKKLFQLFPSILCYFCPVCYSPAVSTPLVLLQGAELHSITKTPEAVLRLESAHIHTDPALRTAPKTLR